MTWRDKFREKFKSDTEAARKLAKEWRRVDASEAKKVAVGTLAARIGELRRGNVAWWSKQHRTPLRTALAELLDVDSAEIFGAQAVPSSALGFPEFPRLKPLGKDEEPCRLTRAGWLFHATRPPVNGAGSARRWIVAPPGSGKSLAIRYLVARHSGEVHAASVATLEDALGHASVQGPLVVEVERASERDDIAAIAKLSARVHPTFIFAPFGFPGLTWSSPGATVSRSELGWEVITWTLRSDWRARLLAWVDQRIEDGEHDSKLQVADVECWLAATDPREILFSTPGDVLALCAEFDAFGPGLDMGLAKRATRWAKHVATAMVPGDAPSTWRARGVAETLAKLSRAHLADAREYGSLESSTWARLVEGAMPRSKPRSVEVGPVAYFEQGGLLRGGPRGLVLYPAWVERGLAMSSQAKALLDPALPWGTLAADASRRPIIDSCLDTLTRSQLIRVARNAAAPHKPSLQTIAAVDATCAALARRCERSELSLTEEQTETVRRVFERQLEHVVPDATYGEVSHPLTRPDLDEWFSTAWTLSLHVTAPPEFSRPELAWEIPGWAAELTFDALPQHGFPSTRPGPAGGAPRDCAPELERVAQLSLDVVDRILAAPVPVEAPRLLLPALFLSDREWNLSVEHFKTMGRSWEERFLARTAEGRSDRTNGDLASRLWNFAAQTVVADGAVPVAERVEVLLSEHAGLAAFVFENLPADAIRKDAANYGTHRRALGSALSFRQSEPRLLLHLPRTTRHAALRGWLDGAADRGARFDEARELVPLLDDDDVELALELVRLADRSVAAEFTAFVWSTWPERAREETAAAVEGALPSCEGWFHTAPRLELEFVAGLVARLDRKPGWIAAWARQRLLDAGPAGEHLFALLRE